MQNNNRVQQMGCLVGAGVAAFFGVMPLAVRTMCTASTNVQGCLAGVDSTIVNCYIPSFFVAAGALALLAKQAGNSNNITPNTAPAVSGDIVSVQPNHEYMRPNMV
jgi:hypothetical protein